MNPKIGGISTLPSAFALTLLLTAGCSAALDTSVQQSQQAAVTTPAQSTSTVTAPGLSSVSQPAPVQAVTAQPTPTQPVTADGVSQPANAHVQDAQPGSTPSATPTADNKYYVDNKVFFIRSVDTESTDKIAMLTFDDGPKGDSTRHILDILDKYNAKALWFISGFNYGSDYQADPNKAEQFKELILEIKKRGHIIGNHTWEHANLKQLPAAKQRTEITELNKLLESITGDKPKFIRPPFGSSTDTLADEAIKQNMQWMNWSVGSLDWELKDPQKVVQQTVSTIHNGANILMHDNEVEVQALDGILQQLTAKGYKFVVPTEVRSE